MCDEEKTGKETNRILGMNDRTSFPFFFFYIPAILFLLPAQLTFTDKRERDTQRLYSAEQMEKKKKKMRAELQKNKKKGENGGGVTLAAASSRLSRPDIYILRTHTHNDKKRKEKETK